MNEKTLLEQRMETHRRLEKIDNLFEENKVLQRFLESRFIDRCMYTVHFDVDKEEIHLHCFASEQILRVINAVLPFALGWPVLDELTSNERASMLYVIIFCA